MSTIAKLASGNSTASKMGSLCFAEFLNGQCVAKHTECCTTT